jgi:hypothetical protein
MWKQVITDFLLFQVSASHQMKLGALLFFPWCQVSLPLRNSRVSIWCACVRVRVRVCEVGLG